MGDAGFTPPLSIGTHLSQEGDNLVAAVSLRNPVDDTVSLTTMTGSLFSVDLLTKRDVLYWGSEGMATQAVTHWELEPNSRVTKHFVIPNTEDAHARAQEIWETASFAYEEYDDFEVKAEPKYVDLGKFEAGMEDVRADWADPVVTEKGDTKVFTQTAVEQADLDKIMSLEAYLPATRDYDIKVSRQYDFRRSVDEELDDSLPEASLDAIRRVS